MRIKHEGRMRTWVRSSIAGMLAGAIIGAAAVWGATHTGDAPSSDTSLCGQFPHKDRAVCRAVENQPGYVWENPDGTTAHIPSGGYIVSDIYTAVLFRSDFSKSEGVAALHAERDAYTAQAAGTTSASVSGGPITLTLP